MKFLILFVLLIISIQTLSAFESRERQGLIGDVKSMREFVQNAQVAELETQKTDKITITDFELLFDNNGNVTANYTYTPDGQLSRKKVFKIANNSPVEKLLLNTSDDVIMRTVLAYNENNKLKEVAIYSPGNILQFKNQSKYDDNNNQIEQYQLNSENEIESRNINTFDAYNNIILAEEFNSNNEITRTTRYEYNQSNQLVSMFIQNSRPELNRLIKYTYTDDKVSREEVYSSEDNLIAITHYKYGPNKQLIAQQITNQDGEVVSDKLYKYDYDTNGNWTRKVELINQIPNTVTFREIQYY